ncbi:Uncharacterised protein [Chlamydia trachomatis]|nr:Uncharacterised protein [Chlamydia trachomatis]
MVQLVINANPYWFVVSKHEATNLDATCFFNSKSLHCKIRARILEIISGVKALPPTFNILIKVSKCHLSLGAYLLAAIVN